MGGASSCLIVDAIGGLCIMVCQKGTMIAAPKARVITIMRMPLAILLELVLVMGLSSCEVIVFFSNLERIFYICFLATSCRFYQVNQHDNIRPASHPCSYRCNLIHYKPSGDGSVIVCYSSGHTMQS